MPEPAYGQVKLYQKIIYKGVFTHLHEEHGLGNDAVGGLCTNQALILHEALHETADHEHPGR